MTFVVIFFLLLPCVSLAMHKSKCLDGSCEPPYFRGAPMAGRRVAAATCRRPPLSVGAGVCPRVRRGGRHAEGERAAPTRRGAGGVHGRVWPRPSPSAQSGKKKKRVRPPTLTRFRAPAASAAGSQKDAPPHRDCGSQRHVWQRLMGWCRWGRVRGPPGDLILTLLTCLQQREPLSLHPSGAPRPVTPLAPATSGGPAAAQLEGSGSPAWQLTRTGHPPVHFLGGA